VPRCTVRRRRAGRPQRSEDRTGPATSGGGRRPYLTRERKILTESDRVLTVRSRLMLDVSVPPDA
jgi:hypothetical protein